MSLSLLSSQPRAAPLPSLVHRACSCVVCLCRADGLDPAEERCCRWRPCLEDGGPCSEEAVAKPAPPPVPKSAWTQGLPRSGELHLGWGAMRRQDLHHPPAAPDRLARRRARRRHWALAPTAPGGGPMVPPVLDPRAALKEEEESEEEAGDAPAWAEPVKDWVNNLNQFKTVGRDIATVKATDLEKKDPVERMALCAWRAHVYDVASAFDAIINSTVFEGAMRQLKPEHTEELMPYIDTMCMSLGQPRGQRELECDQLYGLCTSYQGAKHPVPPPVYDVPTVRLYLIGDSTVSTKGSAARVLMARPPEGRT